MASIILVVTLVGNIILACVLFGRGHYIRYGWLFVTAVTSVAADILLQFTHRNVHSLYYKELMICYLLINVGLSLLVIWESWKWSNLAVRVPVEFYLGVQIAAFLAQRAEFKRAYYDMQVFLAILNILMIYFWCWIFLKKEPLYGRP